MGDPRVPPLGLGIGWRPEIALTIAPNSFMLPGGNMVHVGIPYGPKSRLLAMWMATEVRDHERRPDNHWLEIGRVTHWLRSIGVEPVSGRRGSLNAVVLPCWVTVIGPLKVSANDPAIP